MFLKNRNIISKIKISKVTDYAALNDYAISRIILNLLKYSFLQDDRHHVVRENTLSLRLLLAWHSLIMNETRSEDQIYLKSINLKINLVLDT